MLGRLGEETSFTLSRFRKDLIVMAMNEFPEEYGIGKMSLGSKCKLFLQHQWNSSSGDPPLARSPPSDAGLGFCWESLTLSQSNL